MNKIKLLMLLAVVSLCVACDNDDPSSESIFKNETNVSDSEFDKWLIKNYTEPYNIMFNYLYNDNLTNNSYNVVPASIDKSKSMAIMIKHIWLDAYVETVGEQFVKENTFREFQLIGSGQYSSGGSNQITIGYAENGIRINLFRINNLDVDNVFINQDNPYRNNIAEPMDLNYWYFHTMHHEFCHILTQKKSYSTDYQTISAGKYHSADWINVDDEEAAPEGFVSGYASSEYNEDFAEVYAFYVTLDDTGWDKILTTAGPEGSAIILQKLDLVKSYFQDTWNIDLDELREVVLRRSNEIYSLDLKNLK